MKKWVVVFLVVFSLVPDTICGQSVILQDSNQYRLLALFLSTDPSTDEQSKHAALLSWSDFLKGQYHFPRTLNDHPVLISNLVQDIRGKFLLNYNAESNFGDLFRDEPQFNCLTATALMALALEKFNVEYVIRETNNHVYLIIPEHYMLIETTDENAVVRGKKAIKRMQREYAKRNRIPKYGAPLPLFIDKTIIIDQLVGLLYYNRAIDYIQAEEWSQAMPLLNSAEEFYFSMRITYFKMRVNARLPENSYIIMRYYR